MVSRRISDIDYLDSPAVDSDRTRKQSFRLLWIYCGSRPDREVVLATVIFY